MLPTNRCIVVLAIVCGSISCGGGEDPPQQAQPPAPPPTPVQPQPSTPEGLGAECHVLEQCQRRCALECSLEERDKTDFFEEQLKNIPNAPFKMRIDRAYLEGECGSGGDPLRRRDVDGIAGIVEGTLTYTGDDLLHRAYLVGEMYLHFGENQYREVYAAERSRSFWNRKLISRFHRDVRGVDPWRNGQTRSFHWESRAISPAFCESGPQTTRALVELVTFGVRRGREDRPIGFVNLNWDEVVGMSVKNQPLSLQVRKGRGFVPEPVTAKFSVLDRVFVTRADGNNEWVDRESLVQTTDLVKGPGTSFPVSLSTSEWTVTVKAIHGNYSGGYAPDGEDEYLTVVEVDMAYQGTPGEGGEAPPPGSLRGTAFRLETSPNRWQRPVTKAPGQIDLSSEVPSGGVVSGKVVFERQRFERPFRLEVKTPDRSTSTLDIFSYQMGPAIIR